MKENKKIKGMASCRTFIQKGDSYCDSLKKYLNAQPSEA